MNVVMASRVATKYYYFISVFDAPEEYNIGNINIKNHEIYFVVSL